MCIQCVFNTFVFTTFVFNTFVNEFEREFGIDKCKKEQHYDLTGGKLTNQEYINISIGCKIQLKIGIISSIFLLQKLLTKTQPKRLDQHNHREENMTA